MNKTNINKKWWNGCGRYISGWGFICMILLMLILLTMKNSFMETEPERTLLYEIFEVGKEHWINTGLIATSVFQLTDISNLSEWLIIFFPFIASYTFVTIFCDDFQSGFVRCTAFRMGSQKYIHKIFRYGILSILMTGLTALILFTIFCAVTCVPLHNLPHEEAAMLYKVIWQKNYTNTVDPVIWHYLYPIIHNDMVILFVMLLEGLVSFLLAAGTKNKYFSLCVPCMVLYILVKTSNSLTEQGFGWAEYLSPTIWLTHVPSMITLISLSVFIIAIAENIFVQLLERGVDCLAY